MNNKQSLIIDELTVGLYGHILISSAYWATLDRNLDEFFAIHNDNQHRTDLIKELRWVLLEHPLRKFPVSEIHLNDVSNWLIQCLERVAPHHPLEVETHPDPTEPKFVFKSLSRNPFSKPSEATVTLLEENEVITHGTTGLSSWQGTVSQNDDF